MGLYDWQTLTETANKMKTPAAFILDLLFTDKDLILADSVDIGIIIGDNELAPLCEPDDEAPVVGQITINNDNIKLPYIKVLKECKFDDLYGKMPGIEIYAKQSSLENSRKKKVGLEIQDLLNRITRRKEWIACHSLSGVLYLKYENKTVKVDFLMPAENKPILLGDVCWGKPEAKILNNLRTWKTLVEENTDYTADLCICGKDAANHIISNPEIKEILGIKNINFGQLIASKDEKKRIGELEGMDLYKYSGKCTDRKSPDYFIPPNVCIILASKAPFVQRNGLIKDLDTGKAIAMEYFLKSWTKKNPSKQLMLGQSAFLAWPKQPEAVVYATVC